MINTIWAITTRPAGELPTYCYIRTDMGDIAVKVTTGSRSGLIMITPIETGKTMIYAPTEMVYALVPDTLENARIDIEFELMMRGAI